MKTKLQQARNKIQQDKGKKATILSLRLKRKNFIKPFKVYVNEETD